jgi:RHS repeat-associated protein
LTSGGVTKVCLYPTATYVWGPDRVLAKLDNVTGMRYYYIYNGHGDVIQILDTAGNIVNAYEYDTWGNFTNKNESIHNPFTYFGQTYDETTGLYYLRARYYDPKTGRFTQEDPIKDGGNWYSYCGGNPVIVFYRPARVYRSGTKAGSYV